MAWGGTPKFGDKFGDMWFNIVLSKYSTEDVFPQLRFDTGSVTQKGGRRVIDQVDIPSTNKKDLRYDMTAQDIRRILSSTETTKIDPDALRPRDNPFLHLLPYGSRAMILRELDQATPEFMNREGFTALKNGPLSGSLTTTTSVCSKKSLTFIGVAGLITALYLWSNDSTGLALACGVGSVVILTRKH